MRGFFDEMNACHTKGLVHLFDAALIPSVSQRVAHLILGTLDQSVRSSCHSIGIGAVGEQPCAKIGRISERTVEDLLSAHKERENRPIGGGKILHYPMQRHRS